MSGQTFDSQLPGCVWHRLAARRPGPTGTSVAVQARASDDPRARRRLPWLTQPEPYLRSDGAELAGIDPWADRRAARRPLPDGTGTFELLFQQVTGATCRYS